MTDSEIIKILSEAWDASKGTVQTRLTRGERLAVEMWLDGSALEAAEEEYDGLGGTKIIGNIHENSELLENK